MSSRKPHAAVFAAVLAVLLSPVTFAVGTGSDEAAKSSLYYELDPPFVVNVRDGHRMRYMQVKVQLKTGGPEVKKAVEHHMPAVRHAMIMLLAHQEASSIRRPDGREQVRREATRAIQAALAENGGKQTGVEAVYFTDLVIQ